jgi:hypothetical protein
MKVRVVAWVRNGVREALILGKRQWLSSSEEKQRTVQSS